MSTGAVLRTVRMAAGLSRHDVASRAGVSVSYVGRIERGERAADDHDVMRALVDALAEKSLGLEGRAERELVAFDLGRQFEREALGLPRLGVLAPERLRLA